MDRFPYDFLFFESFKVYFQHQAAYTLIVLKTLRSKRISIYHYDPEQ